MASLEAIEALAQEQGITVPPEAGTAGNAQLLSSPLLLDVQYKNIPRDSCIQNFGRIPNLQKNQAQVHKNGAI